MKFKNILLSLKSKFRKNNNLNESGNRDYNSNITNLVNKNGYSSSTQFLIYVDKKSFKVNIFKGKKNSWSLVNSYLCTPGKSATPTLKGTFQIGVKGLYFGVEKGYKCWYYTSFKGNYLFHSIIYNLDGSVRDGRLGMNLSNGCIRLAKNNAKYIYDNIPRETKVIIS